MPSDMAGHVASGEPRCFFVDGQGGGSSGVTLWVTLNGTLVESVGDGTLYDLPGAA